MTKHMRRFEVDGVIQLMCGRYIYSETEMKEKYPEGVADYGCTEQTTCGKCKSIHDAHYRNIIEENSPKWAKG